jgi:hypothetical protein
MIARTYLIRATALTRRLHARCGVAHTSNQQIFGFEIAVNDTVVVREGKAIEHLVDPHARQTRRNSSQPLQFRPPGATFREFHNEICTAGA